MHLRWIIQPWLPSYPVLCRTKRRFCLGTCQRSTISTRGEGAPSAWHFWYYDLSRGQFEFSIFASLTCFTMTINRTFLRELEQYTDCPELVGRCFLQRVGNYGSECKFYLCSWRGVSNTNGFYCLPLDDGPSDLWEVLSQQASIWKPLEAVLGLCFLPGDRTLQVFKEKNITGFDLTYFLCFCHRSVRKSWSTNWD